MWSGSIWHEGDWPWDQTITTAVAIDMKPGAEPQPGKLVVYHFFDVLGKWCQINVLTTSSSVC